MFDFKMDDDLASAVESVKRFADSVLTPRQREFETARSLPPEVLSQGRDIGLDRIDWPEAAGGVDLGVLARVVVLETLAAGDPAAALVLSRLGAIAQGLLAFGGMDVLSRYANLLDASEQSRAVLVVDTDNRLRAVDGHLSGTIAWVPADRIDLLAVLTRDGLTLVQQGIGLEPVAGSGLCAAGASRVTLDRAPIVQSWNDREAAARTLAHARLDVAALMVGQMSFAAEYSRRYALDRVAFGKPIAHHQALAFLIVDMRTAVDGARETLREAAWRLQNGRPFVSAAAGALLEAIDAGMFVGPNGVQILGAAGFMRDHPVEKAMRELRALSALAGGAQGARDDAWTDASPSLTSDAADLTSHRYGERPIDFLSAEA